MEDDTHDKLTKAYIEYYKANEAFERRKSERTKRAARKWLSTINKLARTRRQEIIDDYNENLKIIRAKRNQNQEGKK